MLSRVAQVRRPGAPNDQGLRRAIRSRIQKRELFPFPYKLEA